MATPQDAPPPSQDTVTEKRSDHPVSSPQISVNGNGAPNVGPGAQAHDLTPTSSTEADKDNAQNPSITVSTFVSPDERDSTRHAEKDKSSLAAASTIQPNTTATGSSTAASSNASRRFSRKLKVAKPPASTSAVPDKSPPVRAPSTGVNKSKDGSQRSPKKASFISKLVRKLVPCVAPNDRAHIVDIDVSDATRPTAQDSSTTRPADAPPPSEKRRSEGESQSQEKEREKVVPPPISVPKDSPPITDQDEVAIPPTPTKALLPVPEIETVTSGAVQPPGSAGSDIFSPQPIPHSDLSHSSSATAQPHVGDTSHSATTDSDGSFTDEEAHGESEEPEPEEGEPMEEDDEDALIMNGGAGIPIGPVGAIPVSNPTSR